MDDRPTRHTFGWGGPSRDPNDEQFGDVVGRVELPDVDDEAVEAVLLGEPYDGAVIGRRGARDGPAALREALAATTTHHFDAGPVGGIVDAGDVRMLTTLARGDTTRSIRTIQQQVMDVTERVHDRSGLPVFLGGDNSLTYPNAAPLLDEGLGCINFDAHLDVRAVVDAPTSGTPYRQLLEEGLAAYACVGARHFETSTDYAEYAREQGAAVVTAEEVGDDPVAAVDRAVEAMDGVDALYVSVDLDVLSAAAAPGVSAPTPGGISPRELFRMLRLVGADDRVAGFEVVECAPRHDAGERTARAGARAVAHFLSGALSAGGASGVPDDAGEAEE